MQATDRLFSFLIAMTIPLSFVKGHGYMSLPAMRGSLWRFPQYPTALPDYDDNGLTAGGPKVVVVNENLHQFGVCGDPYADSRPRPHETGGKYGQGIIAQCYSPGQTIDITIVITAHHKGYFEFQLCKLQPNEREEETCFSTYLINADNGQTNYQLPDEGNKDYHMRFQLPNDVTCDGDSHCVLRWHHMTGNSPGSIYKEEYWNCADIQIGNCNSGPIPTSGVATETPVPTSPPQASSTPVITPTPMTETLSIPIPEPTGNQNPTSVPTTTPYVPQNCQCNTGYGCVQGNCDNCLYTLGPLQACYNGWSFDVCKSMGGNFRWCGY